MVRWTSGAALRVLAVAGFLGAAGPAESQLRTVPAADFVASIGVQVHLNYNAAWGAPQSPYADPAMVEQALAYLNPGGTGIHVLRDTAFYARGAGYFETMQKLGRLGYRWDIYLGYDAGQPDWSEQFATIEALVAAGQVALVEGPLEVDNPGWGLAAKGLRYRAQDGGVHVGWAAAVAGQRDLYARFGGRVPVALWSVAVPGNGAAGGPAAAAARQMGTTPGALCDWGNVHFYQHDGRAPDSPDGGELRRTIAEETGVAPEARRFAITETGFNALNAPGTGYFGTPEVNAQYVLDVLLSAFQAGSALTVLYELFDEALGRTGDAAFEDHWGLFTSDGMPKPAATALHNLMLLAGDGGRMNGEAAPEAATVTGLPRGGQALALRKTDGTVLIVLWPGANLFTGGRRVAVPVAAVRVDLRGLRRDLRVYDPMQGPSPVRTLGEARQVVLELSDHVLVVAVGPMDSAAELHRVH